jgi:hypothetical protein
MKDNEITAFAQHNVSRANVEFHLFTSEGTRHGDSHTGTIVISTFQMLTKGSTVWDEGDSLLAYAKTSITFSPAQLRQLLRELTDFLHPEADDLVRNAEESEVNA